jgi:hypothetical protein
VTSDRWQIAGDVGQIVADSFSFNTIITATGNVRLVLARQSTSIRLGVGSVDRFIVNGDLNNARVSLFDDFSSTTWNASKFMVRGAMTDTSLFSDGSIGGILAGAIRGSRIFAGVDFDNPAVDEAAANGTMPDPDTAGDVFASPAIIKSITVTGAAGAPSFADSLVLAYRINRMLLGNSVQVEDGGEEFGALTHSAGLVAGRTSESVPFLVNDIPLLGSFFTQNGARGRDTKNLVVFITPHVVSM